MDRHITFAETAESIHDDRDDTINDGENQAPMAPEVSDLLLDAGAGGSASITATASTSLAGDSTSVSVLGRMSTPSLTSPEMRSRSRTASRSTSTSSVYHTRLRKLFTCVWAKEAGATADPVAEEMLTFVMSDDFEEVMVAKHGTRKSVVFLGGLDSPPDDCDWDTGAATTPSAMASPAMTTKSSWSALNSPAIGGGGAPSESSSSMAAVVGGDGDAHDPHEHQQYEPEFLFDNRTFSFSRDQGDEVLMRNHVEISRGKGGVFTRCLYSRKPWELVRDVDISMADLVMLILYGIEIEALPEQHNSMSVDVENVDDQRIQVHLCSSGLTELKRADDASLPDGESPLSPAHVALIESLWEGKLVWILGTRMFGDPLVQVLRKHAGERVEFIESLEQLNERLQQDDLASHALNVPPWPKDETTEMSISTVSQLIKWIEDNAEAT